MNQECEIETNFNFDEKKTIGFKTDDKAPLMGHVFEEYDEKQIRNMYDMYMDETNFNYGLKIELGNKIKGFLRGQTADSFLVDIGHKDYIRVEIKKEEISAMRKFATDEGEIEEGTEVELLITEVSENPYMIKGSISAIDREELHEDILENLDEMCFYALVKSSVPAGFVIELQHDEHKMTAFMPNILAGVNKVINPESLIGKTIEVMVESYSSEKGTYIASRKKFLKSLIPYKLETIQNINEQGLPIEFSGKVTGNTTFGVFVEFDECLTGMIHEANLSPEWKTRLKNGTINPDDDITFYVKEIIQSKSKLMLVQEWRETLWDTIEEGQVYDATVEAFKKFGMLARLDSETMGLIRTSDMEKADVDQNLSVGDTVKVIVSSIQRGDRKIYFDFKK